jgi:hypothetical protein
MVLGSAHPSLQLPYSTKQEAVAAGLIVDAKIIGIITRKIKAPVKDPRI